LQMCEEMFRNDHSWYQRCKAIYESDTPIISISSWNATRIKQFGHRAPIFMVTNGVNFDHFPIEVPEKDERAVLIEGFNTRNPAKDPDGNGVQIARMLKKAGFRVYGYSGLPNPAPGIFHAYFQNPSTEEMNYLYRKCHILV